jgi:hypothetical protein
MRFKECLGKKKREWREKEERRRRESLFPRTRERKDKVE